MTGPVVKVLCYRHQSPCQDNACPRCRGYGAVTIRGWRRWLIAKVVGL